VFAIDQMKKVCKMPSLVERASDHFKGIVSIFSHSNFSQHQEIGHSFVCTQNE